jgi:hypothetical protein
MRCADCNGSGVLSGKSFSPYLSQIIGIVEEGGTAAVAEGDLK